jgi:hypothetical protein
LRTGSKISESALKQPGPNIGRAEKKNDPQLMKQIFIGFSIIGALAVLALSVGCATTPQEIKQQSYNPPVFPQ